MGDKGVFALSRGIWDDPDFADEPYTERQAMAWLVSAAAWKPTAIRMNNLPVKLERGDFCFAERFLAEKWSWTPSKVHRFLKRLENRSITRSSKRSGAVVYSLNRYNDFQILWKPSEAENEAGSEASPKQVRSKEESIIKQDNKDNSKELSRDEAISVLCPPLDETHASEVVAYRKRRKQPNTLLALKRLGGQLSQYHDPNDGAAEMITRGWSGFRPVYMENMDRGRGPPKTRTRGAAERLFERHGAFDGIDSRQTNGGEISGDVRGQLPKPTT